MDAIRGPQKLPGNVHSSVSGPRLKRVNPLPAMTTGAVCDCGMRTSMLRGHFAKRQHARNVILLNSMPIDFKAGHGLHAFGLPSTCCAETVFHSVRPPVSTTGGQYLRTKAWGTTTLVLHDC